MFRRPKRRKKTDNNTEDKTDVDMYIAPDNSCQQNFKDTSEEAFISNSSTLHGHESEIGDNPLRNTKPIPVLLETPLSENVVRASTFHGSAMLPNSLKLSNKQTWTAFMKILKQKETQPIVVWGQSGVGKTFGVKQCATAMGYRVFEIEPSSLDSIYSLKKWLLHIGGEKTLLGPRIILVDAVEGIDQSYIKCIQEYLKKRSTKCAPIVFICDDIYAMSIRMFMQKIQTKLRLFRPSDDVLTNIAKNSFAKHINIKDIKIFVDHCNGNLRKLKNTLLQWHAMQYVSHDQYIKVSLHTQLVNSKPHTFVKTNFKTRPKLKMKHFFDQSDVPVSIFGSTSDLIKHKCSIETWERCASLSTLEKLLHDNFCNITDDIDLCSTITKNMSDIQSIQSDYHSFIFGSTFQLIKVQDFKLTLAPMMHINHTKSIPSCVSEYQDQFSQLDIPKLLNDSQTCDTENNHI